MLGLFVFPLTWTTEVATDCVKGKLGSVDLCLAFHFLQQQKESNITKTDFALLTYNSATGTMEVKGHWTLRHGLLVHSDVIYDSNLVSVGKTELRVGVEQVKQCHTR